MAYRRSLSISSTLMSRRLHPSSGHVLHIKEDDSNSNSSNTIPFGPAISNFLPQGPHNGTTALGTLSREKTCLTFFLPMGIGSSFCRQMSSTIGGDSDKIDGFGHIAEVIPDTIVEAVASQAPAVSEVAAAAVDSFFPVAALQYLIDGVHSYTGLNWWASIALTTIIIRVATVPILIDQLKATYKFSSMRPRLEELKQQLNDNINDPEALSNHKNRVIAVFKEYGVSPLTPARGILLHAPIFICFFLAIRNMAEKMPSFQSGGALWFVDLTTPDSLCVLPVLTALTFLLTVECNMQEGMENNPFAEKMKKFFRIFAIISVPFMAAFPKALFCYWLSSNIFALAYGSVMKLPEVKRFVGVPVISVQAPLTSSALKQNVEEDNGETPSPAKPSNFEGTISTSSIIRQRLRSLEKHVKERKDNNKI